MGLEATWTLVDIPPNARDAAQAAARREGIPIGEWLTRRILRRFSELNLREQEEAFTELRGHVAKLAERLEQSESGPRSDPMREAVKKLHQGLARLTDDLVQRTGHSSIQISALSSTFEGLNSKLEEVRNQTSQSGGAFDRRIALLQQNLERLDRRYKEAARVLDTKAETLGQALNELRTELPGKCTRIEQDVVLVQTGLEDLDARQSDAAQSQARKLDGLDKRLEEICSGASQANAAFDQRIALVQHNLEALETRESARSRIAVERFDGLDVTIREARTETSDMCGALDHRLLLVQQSLQSLDSRHSEVSQTLARSLESLASRLGDVRNESSGACAALDQRVTQLGHAVDGVRSESAGAFAAVDQRVTQLGHAVDGVRTESSGACVALDQRVTQLGHAVEDLDAQCRSSLDSMVETGHQNAAVSATVVELERSVGDLMKQFAGTPTNERLLGLEQNLSELASRTGAAEASLAAAEPKTDAIEALLRDLSGKFETEDTKLQTAIAQLRSQLLDDALRAVDAKLDSEEQKQHQAIAELRSGLFDELSAVLDHRTVVLARNTNGKLEEATTPSATAPVFQESGLAPQHLTTQTHDLRLAPEQAAPTPRAAEPASPHEDILELFIPADAHAGDEAAADPRVPASEALPPLFPEIVAAPAPALGFAAAGGMQTIPATPMLTQDDLSLASVQPASYLSAARQSLKAASAQNEPEAGKKEFLSFRRFRPTNDAPQKKTETTSYALVAGIALVAILAIAIAAGELLTRSNTSPNAGVRQAMVATKISAKQRPFVAPATGKARSTQAQHGVGPTAIGNLSPAKIAAPGSVDPNRLASLANAGDAQAQLLIGLQALANGNNSEAVRWLDSAARQGVAVAQYRMGTLYAGGRGVVPDPAKAFHWYAAAAQSGNRKAMSNLAVAYAQGAGAAKNPQEAARWFLKAAQLGLVDAQFDLAVLYERGFGVPQSLPQAYRWYLIAAHAGDRESKDRVDALSSQLSPKDRADAEAAAAQFKPQPVDSQANEPQ